MNGLIQDIDERAAVAWLTFERSSNLKANVSKVTIDLCRTAFLGGFKMAMYECCKIAMGVKDENLDG